MSIGLLILLIAAIIFLLIIFCVVIPIPLWIAAVFSGVKIKISSLVGMRLRRVPPQIILSAMIQAKKADLHDVTSDALEAHFLLSLPPTPPHEATV